MQTTADRQQRNASAPNGAPKREPRRVDLDKMAFALHVPLEDVALRGRAKALGAEYDGALKAWFCPKGKEEALAPFKVLSPANLTTYGNVDQERVNFLLQLGIDAPSPIVDNKLHRERLVDGKKNAKDGAYIFFDDGTRGWGQNHQTGEKMSWKCGAADPARMSPTQLAAQRVSHSHRSAWAAQGALERHRRAREAEAAYEAAAAEAKARWESMPEGPDSHAYASRKGVGLHGVKVAGDALLVPARDIDGKLWTIQTIPSDKDGKKLFMKGGKKSGCFHLIGEIKPGADILVAEGYATGATLYESTGKAVAVAFDAGNLFQVGQALAARHPASLIAFMADNDRYGATNVGVEKAKEAALSVGGAMVAPAFANDAGKPTDWNDLAAAEGYGAVRQQAVRGLNAERQRLVAACLDKVKELIPDAKPSVAEVVAGRSAGVVLPMKGGLVALARSGSRVEIHEARRLGCSIAPGMRVTVAYTDGRAEVAPVRERVAAQDCALER